MYRLVSWEHSYFSGKARAYLRSKAHAGALAYDALLDGCRVRKDGGRIFACAP